LDSVAAVPVLLTHLEQINYSVLFFSERTEGSHEVAVTQVSLSNVGRLDCVEESEVCFFPIVVFGADEADVPPLVLVSLPPPSSHRHKSALIKFLSYSFVEDHSLVSFKHWIFKQLVLAFFVHSLYDVSESLFAYSTVSLVDERGDLSLFAEAGAV
jgi:hypothetical protein